MREDVVLDHFTYSKRLGYYTAHYRRPDGTSAKLSRARWVYEHSFGPVPDGYRVFHVDGDRLNDHIDNLEACTLAELASFNSSAQRVRRICQQCGFAKSMGVRQQFCSVDCFKASRETLVECAWCKELFKADRTGRKLCSNACRAAKQSADATVTTTCGGCRREFQHLRCKPRKYCARNCADLARSLRAKKKRERKEALQVHNRQLRAAKKRRATEAKARMTMRKQGNNGARKSPTSPTPEGHETVLGNRETGRPP